MLRFLLGRVISICPLPFVCLLCATTSHDSPKSHQYHVPTSFLYQIKSSRDFSAPTSTTLSCHWRLTSLVCLIVLQKHRNSPNPIPFSILCQSSYQNACRTLMLHWFWRLSTVLPLHYSECWRESTPCCCLSDMRVHEISYYPVLLHLKTCLQLTNQLLNFSPGASEKTHRYLDW